MDEEANSKSVNTTLEDASWRTSYVLVKDMHNDYGQRLFFNYFSESSEEDLSFVWVRIVVSIIILFLSIGYNAFVFLTLFRFQNMKSVTNYFTANIGFSSLVLCSTVPIVTWSWYSPGWIWGPIVCKMTVYVQGSSIAVSHWTITFLALDRYSCIVKPPYHSLFTPYWAVITCTALWTLTFLIFLPITFWFEEVTDVQSNKVCTLILPHSPFYSPFLYLYFGTLFLAWMLPLPASTYLLFQPYLKMMTTSSIWTSSSTMMESGVPSRHGRRYSEVSLSDVISPWTRRFSTQTGSTRHNSLSQHEEIRLNKRMRVARILCCNAFFATPIWVLTSPIFVFLSLEAIRPISESIFVLKCTIFNNALSVTFLFSFVNMMYYGSCSDNLKRKFKQLLFCRSSVQKVPEIAVPNGTKLNNNMLPPVKQESVEISDK